MAGKPSKAKREFKAKLALCPLLSFPSMSYTMHGKDAPTRKDLSRRSKPRNPKVPRGRTKQA